MQEEILKQKKVVQEITRASDAIRKKHRLIKSIRSDMDRIANDTFKPIVDPLQKLADARQTIDVKWEEPIKKEEKVDKRVTFNESDIKIHSTPIRPRRHHYDDDNDGSVVDDGSDDVIEDNDSTVVDIDHYYEKKFLNMLKMNRKAYLDNIYGVRRLTNGEMMIGNSPIKLNKNHVHVNGVNYVMTPGLLELLFRKQPDETSISQTDLDAYKEILMATNAHRKDYDADKSIRRNKTIKFTRFIAPLVDSSPRKHGKGDQKTVHGGTDYVYWDDPNELVDRLRLLMASQAAGNPSHSNEIISIIEELREAKIIL